MLRRVFGIVCVVSLLTACGGAKWLDSDTQSATQAAQSELLLVETVCASGQPCDPAAVRSLTTSIYCLNAGMLYTHRFPVPDAGGAIQCLPR